MQADRLFSIVYLLLERKQMTAKELAERFEVSQRTIFRDIDALSAAGVPVYARKGSGGGIRLMDHFVLSKSLLTEGEQVDLLAALEGLSAARYPDALSVRQKLSALFQRQADGWISVDFSDWGCEEDAAFDTLKTATLRRRAVRFDYYGRNGERTRREVEPLQLRFKHRAWYLYAFCCERQQPRLFKLTRIRGIELTGRSFERDPQADQENAQESAAVSSALAVEIELWLDASLAYRVYDEFPPEWIDPQPDGSTIVRLVYGEDESLYGYLLSFGAHGRVLSPPHIRDSLAAQCEKMLGFYK
ncbi:MAG: YafY family transcriptional regulator [Clostridia bacterium]|nr:YafY family transcriptional regulator [Clostridia bacterium]